MLKCAGHYVNNGQSLDVLKYVSVIKSLLYPFRFVMHHQLRSFIVINVKVHHNFIRVSKFPICIIFDILDLQLHVCIKKCLSAFCFDAPL